MELKPILGQWMHHLFFQRHSTDQFINKPALHKTVLIITTNPNKYYVCTSWILINQQLLPNTKVSVKVLPVKAMLDMGKLESPSFRANSGVLCVFKWFSLRTTLAPTFPETWHGPGFPVSTFLAFPPPTWMRREYCKPCWSWRQYPTRKRWKSRHPRVLQTSGWFPSRRVRSLERPRRWWRTDPHIVDIWVCSYCIR